ncbi:MAG: tetratricopeptide repeat protein [Fibrobacterota bacterium]
MGKCLVLLSVLVFFSFSVVQSAEDEKIRYKLGNKYLEQGLKDKAFNEFRKVILVFPDHYPSLIKMADIRASQGRHTDAAVFYKKALKSRPDSLYINRQLAKAYAKKGDLENSLKLYRKSRKLAPNDSLSREIDSEISVVADKLGIVPKKSDKEKKEAEAKQSAEKASGSKKKKGPNLKGVSEEMLPVIKAYHEKKYSGCLKEAQGLLKKDPGNSGAYLYAGMARYRLGQYDKAMVNLKKGKNYIPEGYKAHYYIGRIHEKKKRYSQALDYYRNYLRKSSTASEKKTARSRINSLTKIIDSLAVLAERSRRPDVTVDVGPGLKMTASDTTGEDGGKMREAVREYQAGRYQVAMRKFNEIAMHNPLGPNADDALFNLGVYYVQIRSFDKAQSKFEQLAELYPESPLVKDAGILEGHCWYQKEVPDSAESVYKRILGTQRLEEEEKLAIYKELGGLYYMHNNYDKAFSYNKKAADAAAPESKAFFLYRAGLALSGAEKKKQASEYFRRAIKSGSPDSLYYRNSLIKLGDYYYGIKKFDKAESYYREVLKKYPSSKELPYAMFRIGNIYKNNGLFEKAVAMYDKLIKEYPDDYWAGQAAEEKDNSIWENEYRQIVPDN